MLIKNHPRIFLASLLLLFSATFFIINYSDSFATNYCTSAKCKSAEAAEAEARAKASEASAIANSYEAEVSRLNSEIAVIESEIRSYEAKAEDLSGQILIAEAKLTKQQTALAGLMVKMHFNSGESDPLLILAGSETISSLAEKESREETVEEQVIAASKEVKALKQELENEKLAVELLRSDAAAKRSEVAKKRASVEALVAKYSSDASSYLADSEAARKEKEAEIEIARQAYLASLGRNTVLVDPGLDSYAPALARDTGHYCPSQNWRYGYWYLYRGGYICECVSYAGYKVYEYWGISISSWGDAKYWGSSASARGYVVNSTPEPHTVGYYTSGTWGHVIWVESVNSDGTIDYSEYNGHKTASFSYVTGADASRFRYIHFD